MPSEKEVYADHPQEYDALISHEDYRGNILKSIRAIVPLDDLDVVDLGAGTGRLAGLLAPWVRTMLAFDLSVAMLSVAGERLLPAPRKNWLAAAADHRRLPLLGHSVDLIVSGWSISYLAVWQPADWRTQVDLWLAEARRVLRRAGRIILLESLGTGTETPVRLPHLLDFYSWLEEKGFQNECIRTDYRFESIEAAVELAGLFFGEEMKRRIRQSGSVLLPEFTGIWWRRR